MNNLTFVVDISTFSVLFAGVASAVRATDRVLPWPAIFEALAAGKGRWSTFVDFLYPWHQLRLPAKPSLWAAPEVLKLRWQLHHLRPWCVGWSALSIFYALTMYLAPSFRESDAVVPGAVLAWLHTAALWCAYSKRVS